MELEGGCYCKAIRYKVDGDPMFKGQCHCRECQYISGGQTNVLMGLPATSFSYTKGTPKAFQRSDLENPVIREFCGDCGTHIVAFASGGQQGPKMLKIGTLDDPSVFGTSQMAVFTIDQQSFHHIPEGIPTFERTPG